eukprot:CAMPEP_0201715558 /NCGR_PEP_ID=MMETSP0593-20130828/1702_1 /ASSEMBLY_ACC=CAM_ASM_000672 /TAXON_ID=267983 /ORGANISM="Skeletonema japonicum, Strain CCMP2506" /LENGTH=171 /DNA_ID=CAMNT_0048205075 /DNA_START=40 /DNA_END=555 /DNA_ORIENTATION=+
MQLLVLVYAPLLVLSLSYTEAFMPSMAKTRTLPPIPIPSKHRFLPRENPLFARKRIGSTRTNEGLEPGANPNEGYPDQPAWSFDKTPPKASLQSVGPQKKNQSETAAAWILNIVEGAHWLTLPPTFLGSYVIMLNHDFWPNMFGGSELQVLLWCSFDKIRWRIASHRYAYI